MRAGVLVACLIVAAGVSAQAPAAFEPGRRVLLDAHNAYPYQGRWSDRLDRALATRAPVAIEQDLVWRPAAALRDSARQAQSIVSHGEPFTGNEPTLRDFFERIRPVVEHALRSPSRDRWPLITLNLDFKDNGVGHLAEIWKLLGEYETWLTTAPRVADGVAQPFSTGPVLVLTGASSAQQAVFHDAVPLGARLRLFGAVQPGVPGPPNYVRWSNNPWSIVEPEGQNNAGAWTEADQRRLQTAVDAAHHSGLWIRFYTLNGHTAEHGEQMGYSPGYNFGSLDAARIRWRRAIDAGVDFIATDQYEEFSQISSR